MASAKRISYQWRIFVPLAAALWCIVGGMIYWQAMRIKDIRRAMVFDQLHFIAARIAASNKLDKVEPFIKFSNEFFQNASDYDDLTVRIIDPATDSLLANVGPEIKFKTVSIKTNEIQGELNAQYVNPPEPGSSLDHNQRFLYYSMLNNSGSQRITVFLPFTKKVKEVISTNTAGFWIILILIGFGATIFAYIGTLYISRNILLLRNFANRAAAREDIRNVDVSKLPHDELGDITRQIIAIYNQLTEEMDHREQEHRVALHAIEDKGRIKRELTSNINHEIKTPIGIIKGYVDTILADPDMPDSIRLNFLKKVSENIDRLTNLIADITVITKFESGGKLVNISEVNFHDLVYTFASDVQLTHLLGDMKFTFDVPLGCLIQGNESLLQSMINNLVRNAVKYSQGTMCRLELVKEDDKFYHFAFYDDGIGVPPEALPHMFERFFRVNAGRARNAGGTGLGLPIVKVTIESFGGTITVANRQPSGLIYHFTLPKVGAKIASPTEG